MQPPIDTPGITISTVPAAIARSAQYATQRRLQATSSQANAAAINPLNDPHAATGKASDEWLTANQRQLDPQRVLALLKRLAE